MYTVTSIQNVFKLQKTASPHAGRDNPCDHMILAKRCCKVTMLKTSCVTVACLHTKYPCVRYCCYTLCRKSV